MIKWLSRFREAILLEEPKPPTPREYGTPHVVKHYHRREVIEVPDGYEMRPVPLGGNLDPTYAIWHGERCIGEINPIYDEQWAAMRMVPVFSSFKPREKIGHEFADDDDYDTRFLWAQQALENLIDRYRDEDNAAN